MLSRKTTFLLLFLRALCLPAESSKEPYLSRQEQPITSRLSPFSRGMAA